MYTVVNSNRHMGSGLNLTEAFHRIMALAECSYLFHLIRGVMRLTVHQMDGTLVPTDCISTLQDDAMARIEIMRAVIEVGFKMFYAIREPITARELALIEHAIP
jgi:hypothetical protein